MPKRKIIELVEEVAFPRALVIGDNSIVNLLTLNLKHQGCEVFKKETLKDNTLPGLGKRGKYDYIFLFGGSDLIERLVADYLSFHGKLLFIETSQKVDVVPSKKVRVFRAGDLNLWNLNELSDKILRTMFSGKSSLVIDLRRKPHLPTSTNRSISVDRPTSTGKPVYAKKPVSRKPKPISSLSHSSQKRMVKIKPVVRKTVFITRARVLFLVFLTFLFSTVAIGLTFWRILKVQDNLTNFRLHVASSDWQAASFDLKEARQKLQLAQDVYDVSCKILFPLKDTAVFREVGTVLSVSDNLVVNADDLLLFLGQFFKSRGKSFLSQEGLSEAEFRKLADKTRKLENVIVLSKRQLDQLQFSFIPKESFSLLLTSVSDKLVAINEMIPFLEKFLFDKRSKVYLVLFQNNMELRPTGGFIGSFALLTVADGKIINIKIEDVYTADGQLKGHVDPPEPIRKYLSQPHYFLRDSNFDPDFAISGVKAAWFLEKELGKKVDGVVAINLFFVQDLLRATGSIRLSDFNNEEINADNFFLKAHSFAQNKFFPGSTQKKDFLTSVANALIHNLSFGEENTWLEILPAVKRSLEEKNIIIWSFDETLQKMIEEKGFAGRLTEVRCAKSKEENIQNANFGSDNLCMADYLSIFEANLGVNKANYFMSKSIALEKRIDADGKIASVVTISYENSAVPEVHKQATYVNYLRVLVPAESVLKGATFNARLVLPENIDVENYGGDKKSVGFLVKIAPGEKGVIKIAYTLQKSFSKDISSYQLFFQKQGGDKVSPFVLSVIYLSNLKLKSMNFKSTSSREGEIYYTTDTSVDRVFALSKE